METYYEVDLEKSRERGKESVESAIRFNLTSRHIHSPLTII